MVHKERMPESAPYESPKALDAMISHQFDLGELRRFDSCSSVFEDEGVPRAALGMSTLEFVMASSGCGADAHRLEDGTHLLAYVPESRDDSDSALRFVAWDRDGDRRWSVRVDHRGNDSNFDANHRRSFITIPGERHACVGALLQGGTTMTCVERESGESIWAGRMAFWAGLAPVGHGDVFYVADISTLTRRYPYSGAEMRGRKLDGAGGRAAFYASDRESLYFAPARAEEPRLIRYAFDEDLSPTWRRQLPSNPKVGFAHAHGESGVVLVLLEDEGVVALRAEDGQPIWRLPVGDDRPSVAWGDGLVYILNRIPERLNPVWAIEPETGKVRWVAETPAGTLHVHSDGDGLFLQSVRAVREVLAVEKLE